MTIRRRFVSLSPASLSALYCTLSDSVTATPPPQMYTPPTFGPPPQTPSPFIPVPVLQMQIPPPAIAITPPRPTSLDLEVPQRPARGHFKLTDHNSEFEVFQKCLCIQIAVDFF